MKSIVYILRLEKKNENSGVVVHCTRQLKAKKDVNRDF